MLYVEETSFKIRREAVVSAVSLRRSLTLNVCSLARKDTQSADFQVDYLATSFTRIYCLRSRLQPEVEYKVVESSADLRIALNVASNYVGSADDSAELNSGT